MAFFSDRDILRAIKGKTIRIEPFNPKHVGPGSVDCTLGNVFRVFRNVRDSEIDVRNPKALEKLSELINVGGGEFFLLLPHELVLATTREKVGISDKMVGFIEGRSSYARIGVAVHVTASFIQPGSYGIQTLEIYNLTNFPIKLYPGERVCQIIFAETKSKAKVPYGKVKGAKYYDQKGPETAK
ncbi:MAG: dCTP deaminase [archaeon]